MINISYESYLALWHAHPRHSKYGYGPFPEPMTRAKWEDYGATLRAVEINALTHQNRLMSEQTARAAMDVPATMPELAW